jgi:regulator of protease activity HflC (stomatin/prohibitin superfamily)
MMYIVPFVDSVRFVDLRLLTLNIPSQQVITKDNVPAAIDGVLFFLVADAEKAVILIQDFAFAIAASSDFRGGRLILALKDKEAQNLRESP